MDNHCHTEFDSVTADLTNMTSNITLRTGPISFSYETPLQTPRQIGAASADSLTVSADIIVAFGMAEVTHWSATAIKAVIDPQHDSIQELLSNVNATHVAVVLNEHEACKQANCEDSRSAGHFILNLGVDCVVIKQGVRGGLVMSSNSTTTFGACPTETVDLIGSGDAFTAGFAHAWAVESRGPSEAAQFAARVAAAHSIAGGVAGFSKSLLGSVPNPIPYIEGPEPSIYLAGPFFNMAQRRLITLIYNAFIDLGVEVFSPLHQVGFGGDQVADKDLSGLLKSKSVLAVLDGADAGTLFEVGWATNAGIPVVGFADNLTDHRWTMLRGTGSHVTSDLSSAVYTAAWAALGRCN
jgi:nucleoside 2-deoxyribosyltransferase